jgi:hypothetical protein
MASSSVPDRDYTLQKGVKTPFLMVWNAVFAG